MKITVGSTNPVKLAAARAVFERIAPDMDIDSVSVEPGVPDQPWGDEQTRQGALTRARHALANDATYGVGFEGGLVKTELGIMTCAWCAVVSLDGTYGVGGGVNVLLPPTVAEAVKNGEELGPAMDKLVGERHTKKGPGAVGILTEGLSDRQTAYEHILIMALAPFRRRDLYMNSDNEGNK